MESKRIDRWMIPSILLIVILLVSACQSSGTQNGSSEQGSTSPGEENTSASDANQGSGQSGENEAGSDAAEDPMDLAERDWQTSGHASSFVLDDQGNNNSCARCHAPKNWAPTLADIPESCAACKFELPEPPPFIAESDWTNVSCIMCHTIDKKGNVQAEVAWLEIPALDEYASVESPSELCLHCHNTENLAAHGQVNVGSGHAEMACLECHSPHSTAATCGNGDCHSDVFTEMDQIPGHDEDHKDVSCAACHDSAGWDVGPDPETSIWVTFSPWSQEEIIGEEDSIQQTGTVPFLSHDLGVEVNCERCHFPGNTWGLTESVGTP